jgi:hypothetical protein
MTITNQLKSIISLGEKRSSLLNKISVLDEKIAKLQRELLGASKEARGAAPQVTKGPKVIAGGRKRRGALREQILETLDAVGEKGITVRDLAARLGTKPANIHSWFSTNAKKIRGLKKTGEAQYTLIGGAAAKATSATKAAKPAKAIKAPKAPKAPKAAKVAAPARKAGRPAAVKGAKAPAKRGELKNQILAELKKAGNTGITIKDLSDKVNTKYKNLYIWFVTTGKRIPGIEKVGPAQYRLKA